MEWKPIQIGNVAWRVGERPLLIAGPCVIESLELCLRIADTIQKVGDRFQIPVVFKASFDKANRTSFSGFRGPGMDDGLEVLAKVAQATGMPVTTDVHLPDQSVSISEVCHLLQIPAFLARQTDLLVAAARTGKPLNVKKGQFMAPEDMQYVVEKVQQARVGNRLEADGGVMLCERGTFFGYGRLVNDMQGIPIMQGMGVPVIFDATHSVQRPGGLGGATGGNRAMVEPLARAAAATGCNGFFFETHPDPDRSPSDGPNMVPLTNFEGVVGRVLQIWETVRGFPA